MKPVLPTEERKDWSIEDTIMNNLYDLSRVFDLRRPTKDHNELDLLARKTLTKEHYIVFRELYMQEVKITVKSIFILRKISKMSDYDEKFSYMVKHIKSPRKVQYTLEYIEHMYKPSKEETPKGYFQDWFISRIRAELNEINEIKG